MKNKYRMQAVKSRHKSTRESTTKGRIDDTKDDTQTAKSSPHKKII
jgi:hypothetical protein